MVAAVVVIEHLEAHISEIAGRFDDLPSRPLQLIGDTGTN